MPRYYVSRVYHYRNCLYCEEQRTAHSQHQAAGVSERESMGKKKKKRKEPDCRKSWANPRKNLKHYLDLNLYSLRKQTYKEYEVCIFG